MDFKALQDRALQIREKLADFEAAKTGKVWSRQDIMLGFVGDLEEMLKVPQND